MKLSKNQTEDCNMKKIDKYIYKKFLATYLISISIILSIAVVFDLSEKIDNFIDNDAPLKLIFQDYYLFL